MSSKPQRGIPDNLFSTGTTREQPIGDHPPTQRIRAPDRLALSRQGVSCPRSVDDFRSVSVVIGKPHIRTSTRTPDPPPKIPILTRWQHLCSAPHLVPSDTSFLPRPRRPISVSTAFAYRDREWGGLPGRLHAPPHGFPCSCGVGRWRKISDSPFPVALPGCVGLHVGVSPS